MLEREEIKKFLHGVGVAPTDTVIIHTSMKSLGEVSFGCDGLIDAFCDYLSDGLFLVPTHTWANVGSSSPVFDVRKTAPCIGALPTVAAFRQDGIRSLHPTHSIVGFGKRAAEFLSGEEKCTSPCPPGGAWARLYDEDAKILLIGVGLDKCTYVHAIDEIIDLKDRLAAPTPLTVIDGAGNEYKIDFCGHASTGSRNFEVYRKPLAAHGALKTAMLGNATVTVVYARRALSVIEHLWKKADHDLTKEPREIPESDYSDLFIPPEAKSIHSRGE